MSSLGSHWKIIRHYLSMTNLNSEVEKLVQKLKPATPEQWDSLITRFEKAVSARFTASSVKEIQSPKPETKQSVQSESATIEKEQQQQSKPVEEKNNVATKVDKSAMALGAESKEMTFANLLQGLKLKTDLHFGKISEPSWKTNKPTVSKSSIHSRTAYVISAIVTAETPESLQKRTENFIEHLLQYPESRDYAIKEGGVRALLRAKGRAGEAVGAVNEALSLLGYTGPTKGPGPNILSIDGGGIRGLIAIEILKHLEKLTGKRVEEMFDLIVGVSTGAIIAAVIGSGVGNIETAHEMYHTLSKKMFGNTSIIGGTSRLVWSQSYYDTAAWEKLLQDNLGDRTLSQCNRYNTPKMALISCCVNPGSKLTPFVFRTYCSGYRMRAALPGASAAPVWHAVRASAAAPAYFGEFSDQGGSHHDGGIMVNNPTGVAIHEAKVLFGPDALKYATIISVGTGKALKKHMDYQIMSKEPVATSWKDKFNMILDSATDTEGTHLLLNDLLPPGSYFRLNPPLMAECAMDEVRPDKLASLLTDTQAYIRRNQIKFEQAAYRLSRKRSILQKAMDYAEYQAQLLGVVQTK